MVPETLHLKVMVPERIIVDEHVDKVIAEAPNGFFCLKPRHIDFTAALRPGILYSYKDETEQIIAVDEGILVKCGKEVLVSVIGAIKGDDLTHLEQQVRDRFLSRERADEAARIALKKMEADLIRRFVELEKSLT